MEKKTDIALNVTLKRKEVDFAREARKYLELSRFNIYSWCDFMGYELRDRDFFSPDGTGMIIRTPKRAYIGIKRTMPYKEKIVSIAHEVFHDKFHASCVAFRMLNSWQVDINEGKAELFATLVMYPTMEGFETEQDFISNSGLPYTSAEIRLNYFRRTGI